jgi:protein TonB
MCHPALAGFGFASREAPLAGQAICLAEVLGRKVMQQPNHVITQPGVRWTNERIVGVGFVALLHVIAIWAILNGLVQKFVKAIDPPPIIWTQPVTHPLPPQPVPRIPHVKPTELTHQTVMVPPPPIDIAPEKQPPLTGSPEPQPPATPDSYASGVSGTHTIPDYPSLARKLGEQGSVRLSLAISASGDVTGANVVRSSGFPDLDQTAVDWVMSHWKYKPATHGGVAMPSQTQAVVVFNLKNAR